MWSGAYLAWANLLMQQGKEKESRKKLFKALDIDPDFPLATTNLAWRFFQDNEFETCIEYFLKVLKVNPDNITAYNGIAQSYRSLEEYDKAEEYFKLAIEKDPTISWIPLNYANMKMYNQKDTAGAMELFNAAKETVKDPIAVNFALINILYAQGYKDSVLSVYEEILELDDSNIHALASLTGYYHGLESYDKSIETGLDFLARADTLTGDGTGQTYRVYNTLAMAYYGKQEFEQSVASAWKAINKLPENPIAYTSLAEAYYYWGKIDLFYKYIQQSFDLGLKIDFVIDDEPYASLLGDPRFKAIYEKDILKN